MVPLPQGMYEALKVEIENVKDDIKEIKDDNKEVKTYYRDVITELKENSIRQTEILNNQERQFARVNSDLEKVNTDIADLSDKFDSNLNTHTKWYQDFLNNNFGLVFKMLVILVLLLAGVKLAGLDFDKLMGLLKGGN
jgi:predicted nuclease with TOPRIM domain